MGSNPTPDVTFLTISPRDTQTPYKAYGNSKARPPLEDIILKPLGSESLITV